MEDRFSQDGVHMEVSVQPHTVQPESFSTVGAFSTVATVLDES